MRIWAVTLVAGLSSLGCASLGRYQMSDGSYCETASADFHERTAGRSGAAWFQHESTKRGMPLPRRSMETNAEYRARVDCVRAAQTKAFQLCLDRGNGLIDEGTRSRQTAAAFDQCGAVPLFYRL